MNEAIVGTAFQVIAPDGYAGDIDILSHKETPGLGNKIMKEEWRSQFKGRSLEDGHIFAVKKDGGDINQFSGATISPRAVVDAVKKGLDIYNKEFGNGG